jgi:uncharacterized DUF497 family protein
MDVEFDADKDAVNRFKHRLPLAFGKRVFDDPDVIIGRQYGLKMRKNGSRRSGWSMANCLLLSMSGAAIWFE